MKTYTELELQELLRQQNNWIEINYDNPPSGDVLLLTTSKTILKGDWYENNLVKGFGWRTERSRWEFSPPEGKEYLTLTPKEEVTHYCKLPNIPSPLLPTEEVGIKEDYYVPSDKLYEFAKFMNQWYGESEQLSDGYLKNVIKDYLASKGNPQPSASLASHSCTIDNSIEQKIIDDLTFLKDKAESPVQKHFTILRCKWFRIILKIINKYESSSL